MDIEIVFSTTAILLSCLSLYISFKTSKRDLKVKNIELRSALLIQHCELQLQIAELKNFSFKLKEKATEKINPQLYKLVDSEDWLDDLSEKAEILHEQVTQMSTSQALSIYELIYHDLYHLRKEVTNMLSNKKTELSEYLKENRN